ncbi:MAG: tetratricopeptide repeat protein [Acidobacteria bacterium]|nr:tetratricopeptide repeat protein [Acidobacteriota bacterium]
MDVTADAPPVSGVSSTVVLALTLVAVAVFAVMAWRYARDAPPPSQPDPRMFTIATLPPQLPDVAPRPPTPGAEEHAEGRRLARAGDLEGARSLFAAAVAADGSNAVYRTAYGRTLWDLGQRQQALAELGVAARLDPNRELAYARALDIAGDRSAAVNEYEVLLARDPMSAVVHEHLGRLQYRSGNYGEAVPHLEQAVAGRPNDPVLRQELGYALDAAGEKARAAEVYREVLAVAPEAVISRGLLADNLYAQGEKDEAMAVVQEGLDRTPEAPLLQRQLGSLLERNGRRAEAAAAYRRYAQLAPNASDAQELTKRAAQLDGGTGGGGTP